MSLHSPSTVQKMGKNTGRWGLMLTEMCSGKNGQGKLYRPNVHKKKRDGQTKCKGDSLVSLKTTPPL